jgi:hypothetical protein
MAILAREAAKRVGSYFYILPYYKQARKIIWEGMDKTGFRMLDHIPHEFVETRNNQEMTMKLKNGSMIAFLGSDNIDSIVGTNPVGVIFSEYSLHKENAWNYLRPILLENGGWALFNGTPRGRNHLYHMLKQAKTDPNWFSEVLTIDDTNVMKASDVSYEIEQGMPKSIAKQEFYCSFDAALSGAYYGEAMERMQNDSRITNVPHETSLPVNVAWDLGISDSMVLLLFQRFNREIRIIDMITDNGQSLDFYVKKLNSLPYNYGYDILPHDVRVRELASGVSRYETLSKLGRRNLVIMPKLPIEEGINAVRSIMPRTWIDKTKCDHLIEALRAYRARFDEEKQVYCEPVHDWASHAADAMRMLACGIREDINENNLPVYAEGVNTSSGFNHGYSSLGGNHDITGVYGSSGFLNYNYGTTAESIKEQLWNPMDYLNV